MNYNSLRNGKKYEIQNRVDTESWVNNCKGYPCVEEKDIINVLCPRIK